MRQTQSQLPVLQYQREIIKLIDSEMVSVISGQTGCGKSTQIPQMILRRFPKARIAVCEPRRLAATSLAERVSHQMRSSVGDLVGYHIGMEPKVNEKTKIIFMTYGILIQKLMHNQRLKYSHIILDEVHERSLQMDYAFIALKRILEEQRRKDMKIVVMSATINSEEFRKYFSVHKKNGEFYKPQIKYDFSGLRNYFGNRQNGKTEIKHPDIEEYERCGGFEIPFKSRYQVDVYYLDDLEKSERKREEIMSGLQDDNVQITNKGYKMAVNLIQKFYHYKSGDILVFLPGMSEINKIKQQLFMNTNGLLDHRTIVFVHSAFSDKIQRQLFNNSNQKIILATNMGQSSVTLPECKLVIDFGLNRKSMTSSDSRGLNYFRTMKASKSNLIQRAGRVGRVSDGEVFRLITREQYGNLSEFERPQIKNVSLEMTILKIKMMDQTFKGSIFEDPYDLMMSAMEPPSPTEIHKATHFLVREKALLNSSLIGGPVEKYVGKHLRLSEVGNFMANIPCSFNISKMILLSLRLGIPNTMIDIASILMSTRKFFLPEDRREKASLDSIKDKYGRLQHNDFLIQKRLFYEWKRTFFFPFAKEYFQKKRQKVRGKAEDQQETISLIEDEDFINNDDENNFIERFCNQRVQEKETNWLKQNALQSSNMREILKINENIRLKLMKYNFDFPYEEEDDVSNDLVLMCLGIAFSQCTCLANYESQQRKKENSRHPHFEDYEPIQQITLETNKNLSQEQLVNEISLYLSPGKPNEIKLQGRNKVCVKGQKHLIDKLLLNVRHKPKFQCSAAFKKALSDRRYVRYTSITPYLKSEMTKLRVSSDSVLADEVRINQTLPHFIYTNEITESKKSIFFSTGALVNGPNYYLIRMIVCKELEIGYNQNIGYIDNIRTDGYTLMLPFHLTKQLVNQIIQIRNTCYLFGNTGNLERQLEDEKIRKIQTILHTEAQTCALEKWEEIYRREHRNYHSRQTYFIPLNSDTKVNIDIEGYQQGYKKWKLREYKSFHQTLKFYTIKTPKLICEECLTKGGLKVIEDLSFFDFEKKFLRIDKKSKRFKVRHSKLYCKNNHKIGFLFSDELAVLSYSKVLIYIPFKQYFTFQPNTKNASEYLKHLEKGLLALEENRKDWQRIACRMCSDYMGHTMQKNFIVNEQRNFSAFMGIIHEHVTSDEHKNNTKKFLRTVDI